MTSSSTLFADATSYESSTDAGERGHLFEASKNAEGCHDDTVAHASKFSGCLQPVEVSVYSSRPDDHSRGKIQLCDIQDSDDDGGDESGRSFVVDTAVAAGSSTEFISMTGLDLEDDGARQVGLEQTRDWFSEPLACASAVEVQDLAAASPSCLGNNQSRQKTSGSACISPASASPSCLEENQSSQKASGPANKECGYSYYYIPGPGATPTHQVYFVPEQQVTIGIHRALATTHTRICLKEIYSSVPQRPIDSENEEDDDDDECLLSRESNSTCSARSIHNDVSELEPNKDPYVSSAYVMKRFEEMKLQMAAYQDDVVKAAQYEIDALQGRFNDALDRSQALTQQRDDALKKVVQLGQELSRFKVTCALVSGSLGIEPTSIHDFADAIAARTDENHMSESEAGGIDIDSIKSPIPPPSPLPSCSFPPFSGPASSGDPSPSAEPAPSALSAVCSSAPASLPGPASALSAVPASAPAPALATFPGPAPAQRAVTRRGGRKRNKNRLH